MASCHRVICIWTAQKARRPLNALLMIDVASAPLVCDWVALRQALVHVEAIRHLSDAHQISIVVVFARTLEANDLVVQNHLLALCITGSSLSARQDHNMPSCSHGVWQQW